MDVDLVEINNVFIKLFYVGNIVMGIIKWWFIFYCFGEIYVIVKF